MIEHKFKEKTGIKFNDFYAKYRPKLVWYLMRMSKDQMTAEEVADEGFIKSLDELDKYHKEKAHFSTWLFTIAKRIMFQKLKDRQRFESIEEDHDGATIADFLIADDTDSYNYEHSVSKKSDIIKSEIPRLPQKYATVLTLREIDGLAYQEISEVLNLNLSTVKSQIRQGRIMLRKKTQKSFETIDSIYS